MLYDLIKVLHIQEDSPKKSDLASRHCKRFFFVKIKKLKKKVYNVDPECNTLSVSRRKATASSY